MYTGPYFWNGRSHSTTSCGCKQANILQSALAVKWAANVIAQAK